MIVTIYYNPNCSTCRKAVKFVHAKGIEPKLINYLKNGLKLSEVKEIYKALKIESPHDMLRAKEEEYALAGLSPSSDYEAIFNALVRYPKLLQRPIVITPTQAKICRPPELVNEIL